MTMDDRTLLELAAKAAGIKGVYFHSDNPIHVGIFLGHGHSYWNPLTDDGDAQRLAVELRLDVRNDERATFVGRFEHEPTMCEQVGNDRWAATRRAIVRAAAAIGQQKEG